MDTVRTIDELLTVLFASDQAPHSISEQDVRDAIVSISLETADLSSLPRSTSGLNPGRLWIDATQALRCNLTYSAPLMVRRAGPETSAGRLFAGEGVLSADAQVPLQANTYEATATFAGAGGTTVDASQMFRGANVVGSGSGGVSASAATNWHARMTRAGAGGVTASARLRAAARGTMAGAGAFVPPAANIVTGVTVTWGTKAPSITLSNGNLTATRTGLWDGAESNVKASAFRASGKRYFEMKLAGGSQTSTVGLGNPSATIGDELGIANDANSIAYYSSGGVGGLAGPGTGWIQELAPFGLTSTISFAVSIGVGWWARVDGGSWWGSADGGWGGDPATGTNPITTLPNATGGLGPVASFNSNAQSVTLRIAPGSWAYSAPSGFSSL